MKKFSGSLLLVFYLVTASSQPLLLNMEAGKVISSFDYKDSEGNSLNNLTGSMKNCLGMGLRMYLFETDFHFSCGVTYNKYESKGSDATLGNYYEWEVEYLGAHVGIDYEFFKPPVNRREQHGFSFYLRGIFATDFLLRGTQILNSQVYDLRGEEEFDRPVYFLKGGIGGNYYISQMYIVYVQYTYGRSILIGNYAGKEQLRFNTHTMTVGFTIDLFYSR